jgi:hypothetical protein
MDPEGAGFRAAGANDSTSAALDAIAATSPSRHG